MTTNNADATAGTIDAADPLVTQRAKLTEVAGLSYQARAELARTAFKPQRPDPGVYDPLYRLAIPGTGFPAEYMAYAIKATPASRAFHVSTYLALVSLLCPGETGFTYQGETVRGRFWGLMIGPSGSRKSSVMRVGTSLIERLWPSRADSSGVLLPVDCTKEGLWAELHARAGRRSLYAQSEFGGFLELTGERGKSAGMRTSMHQLFDETSLSSRTAKDDSAQEVHAPRVSFLAACTPYHVRKHLTNYDFATGFVSRFAMFWSGYSLYEQQPGLADVQRAQELTDRVRGLHRRSNRDGVGECLGFTPEAAKVFRRWERTLAYRREYAPDRVSMGSGYSRVKSLALQIAYLYSINLYTEDNTHPHTLHSGQWSIGPRATFHALVCAELHLCSLRRAFSESAVSAKRRRINRGLSALRMVDRPMDIHTLRDSLGEGAARTLGETINSMRTSGYVTETKQVPVVYDKEAETWVERPRATACPHFTLSRAGLLALPGFYPFSPLSLFADCGVSVDFLSAADVDESRLLFRSFSELGSVYRWYMAQETFTQATDIDAMSLDLITATTAALEAQFTRQERRQPRAEAVSEDVAEHVAAAALDYLKAHVQSRVSEATPKVSAQKQPTVTSAPAAVVATRDIYAEVGDAVSEAQETWGPRVTRLSDLDL